MVRTILLLSIISVSLAIKECKPNKRLTKFKVHLADKWMNPKILGRGRQTNEEKFAAAKTSTSRNEARQQIWEDLKKIITDWADAEVKQKDKKAKVRPLFLVQIENRFYANLKDKDDPFRYQTYCELLNTYEQNYERHVEMIKNISPLKEFFEPWEKLQTVKCGSSTGGSWDCKIKVDPTILNDDRLSSQLESIIRILTRNPIPVSKTAGRGVETIKLAHRDQSKAVGPWMMKTSGTSDRLAASLDKTNHLIPPKGNSQAKLDSNLKEADFQPKPTMLYFDHIIAEH